ncbi:MoxR-like ATPase [Actinoplanes italicus]|uniref:Dynein-related subfamily AAA family protein n=1 Tax=Actinoplanes italicus TaxID=113567 RepID=A0A2T0KB82_9ACTN|nr:MoxR family ATPase [Actinoplanes italicus]PRX20453.1 dynein-related subfamily AAA family protein [Actinoplanes italicus]GIE36637.1 MoxR-like ATPase [Actinoplanes italicus]
MINDPDQLRDRMAAQGYLAGDGLAEAAYLSLKLERPLFLEGDPGVGKTDFARKLAGALGRAYVRLQCHSGLDAAQALYEWNFPQQILALRSVDSPSRREELLEQLYDRKFLLRRPILRALQDGPAVLLIDEIDRADDEFEAVLLQVLEDYEITIPELADPIPAAVKPIVVLTSNRTREVHDALKRRCLYYWIDHPKPDQEEHILRVRVQGLSERLAREIAEGMGRVRDDPKVTKAPGVAEALDFASALVARDFGGLDEKSVRATVTTLAKDHADRDRIIRRLLP